LEFSEKFTSYQPGSLDVLVGVSDVGKSRGVAVVAVAIVVVVLSAVGVVALLVLSTTYVGRVDF